MIVLKEQNTAQSFNFIPRNDYDTLTITNETTNETQTITILTDVETKYYRTISAIFNLKENNFYILELLNGSDVVYRTKVFCTNQNIVSFSVNNGNYTSHSSNNEFIIYE